MTIPGYSPLVGVTMQNHIHLGVYGLSGLLGHNEPPYRFGHILKRVPIYESAGTVVRSWNLTPGVHVTKLDGTNPTVLQHFSYTLRTDYTGLDLLKNLYKRECMFVEAVHCADSADHANYRWRYFFDSLSFEDMQDPMGNLIVATITMTDLRTVTPIA